MVGKIELGREKEIRMERRASSPLPLSSTCVEEREKLRRRRSDALPR
jgi:hypothetical protein